MATIRLTRDVLQEVFVTYPAGTVITDADNGWADAHDPQQPGGIMRPGGAGRPDLEEGVPAVAQEIRS